MRKTKFLHSVLEKSGRVNLQCSFTYDFSLHETLKVWWEVQKGDEKVLMNPKDANTSFARVSFRISPAQSATN